MKQIAEFSICIIALSSVILVVTAQECETSSDVSQCSEGQICRNNLCETAQNCTAGADCSNIPGFACVADYCQPATCTVTGQCVYGQKCSQNAASKTCVYPVMLEVEEKTPVVLTFPEPGSVGTYEEITWYKDQTESSQYRLVFVHPAATGGEPLYYNEFCSGSSPCETSSKGELNVDTGDLTIYSVNTSDEGFYYYDFYIDGGTADTGHKYEINMEVYVAPKPEDLSLTGIPDDYVEVSTDLELTCTLSRIKPEADEMYWIVGGLRENGSLTVTTNGDGTFRETNVIIHTVSKDDENADIRCVVVPVHGEITEVARTINPGYGPTGEPYVEPTISSKHTGEMVVLLCNNPDDDGNPDCDLYTWDRVEGSDGNPLPTSKSLEFIMDEYWAGNYTCTCGNAFGTSDVSAEAEVIFLRGPTAMSHD